MVEMREVKLPDEQAELTAMEERIFSTDRFQSWAGYEVFWMIFHDQKVGSIAFVPNLMPGLSWDEDAENQGNLWLVSIGVDPDFQRMEIGTEAMHWLINHARERGIPRIISNFRVSNHASRRLHQKCGFETVSIIPDYYRDPQEDAELVRFDFTKVP
jgi:ribosomal protein S18 acetylase RimI-like enzyme